MMTILGMLVNKLMTRSQSQVIGFGPEFSCLLAQKLTILMLALEMIHG